MNRLKRLMAPMLCASVLSGAVHAEERTLRVYNWFDYITPKALEDSRHRTRKPSWSTTSSIPTKPWKPSC